MVAINQSGSSSSTEEELSDLNGATECFKLDLYHLPVNRPREVAEILVVDDNPMVREVVMHLLQQMHLPALQAGNGHEAIAILKEHNADGKAPIQLVIMDLSMPEMGGIEATQAIRRLSASNVIAKLPTIVGHTGFDDASVRQACVEAGMTEILVKHCPPEEFKAAIRKYFG